jgi:hypothetical protein
VIRLLIQPAFEALHSSWKYFEKRGDCSPKFLNCARLHFA